jgi:hypothetical protein
MSENKPLDPEQTRFIAKVRRLMMIASATTFVALALITSVIGYRVFRSGESGREIDITSHLPKEAKIVSTVVAGDKVIVTIEVGPNIEVRTFDLQNLRPTGRLRFTTEP